MKQGQNEICYTFFATLANPTRLAILEHLQEGPMNVSGLADVLDQEQSMISHNLKLLECCSFIEFEKRGKEKFVALNGGFINSLFSLIGEHFETNCEGETCPHRV